MNDDWAPAEMAGARVWDARCTKSLSTMARKLAESAGLSWSAALGSGTRQAAGDICGDPGVSAADLLRGHVQQTVSRCREHDLVVVDQDTSALDYSTHQATEGLGPVSNDPHSLGYFLHSAFALSPEGVPLGLLAADMWARDPAAYGQKCLRAQRAFVEKESYKWVRGLQAVEAVLPDEQPVLLVQDRESDVYDFLLAPRRANTHLLLRACYPRRVQVPEGVLGPETRKGTLFAVMQDAPEVGRMTVSISPKPGQTKRTVTLAVHCLPLRLCKPRNRPDLPDTSVEVTVVRAVEVDVAEGQKALEWVLLTTLAVRTAEDACRVVRYCALRWPAASDAAGIERFHYVLKSGCKVERLQMDDLHTLQNALAICCIVAWRLMHLAYQARQEPEAPAEVAFTREELTVLHRATGRRAETLREAVRAVGVLGGFEPYPSAGEPGLKRLWQGLRQLAALVWGWRLARDALGAATATPDWISVLHFMTQD